MSGTRVGRILAGWRAEPSTPELWHRLWAQGDPTPDPMPVIEAEEASIRWQKIAASLIESLGGLAGRSAVELGSGAGLYSAILARREVEVTLVDYEPGALALAAARFERLGLRGRFLLCDACSLSPDLDGRFDIAMSFGTIEHLRRPEREVLWQAHAQVLRPGGVLIASVPNRAFLPHRLLKGALQLRGRWWCGYEGTLGRRELYSVARRLGLAQPRVVGTCFVADCRRTWRLARETRLGRRVLGTPRGRSSRDPRREQAASGWWDDYLGHELVLLGRKNDARGQTPHANDASDARRGQTLCANDARGPSPHAHNARGQTPHANDATQEVRPQGGAGWGG